MFIKGEISRKDSRGTKILQAGSGNLNQVDNWLDISAAQVMADNRLEVISLRRLHFFIPLQPAICQKSLEIPAVFSHIYSLKFI
ncbi:MAG TPA: hypothetical protein DCR87_05250 [Acidobacteria bacterium]|nr:hypothetical protein [Acidobacteriota bacterium]